MAAFVFPTSAELRAIEQEKLPRLMANRPIFDIFPARDVDDHLLVWEQMDNYLGLQQVRGLDGAFPRVKKVGAKRYIMEPGVYGEFIDLDELELTRRRTLGSYADPVSLDDLVTGAQDQLLQRRLDRIELIVWTLLATGTFSVAGPTAAVVHSDTYTVQTSTPGITWATSATAVPLANFRTVQLLGPARGADFGAGAEAWMNRTTFNSLITNTNAADLGGRYTVLMNTLRSEASVNTILTGEGLPTIRVYDEGYFTDAGSFTRFIPNNKVVVIGRRPNGAKVGEYRFTRNANNPNMAPGIYTDVIDSLTRGVPPRRIDVYDSHNGGPVIYFPGAIVIMTV
jgi:hypothetical protein